jgi:hypothetical protein
MTWVEGSEEGGGREKWEKFVGEYRGTCYSNCRGRTLISVILGLLEIFYFIY